MYLSLLLSFSLSLSLSLSLFSCLARLFGDRWVAKGCYTHPRISDRFTLPAHSPPAVTGSRLVTVGGAARAVWAVAVAVGEWASGEEALGRSSRVTSLQGFGGWQCTRAGEPHPLDLEPAPAQDA